MGDCRACPSLTMALVVAKSPGSQVGTASLDLGRPGLRKLLPPAPASWAVEASPLGPVLSSPVPVFSVVLVGVSCWLLPELGPAPSRPTAPGSGSLHHVAAVAPAARICSLSLFFVWSHRMPLIVPHTFCNCLVCVFQ